MIKILKNTFSEGLRHWKIVVLVYFLQLLVAIPLAMQVWHVFEASIGNSLEINKLLPGYDHTVISDFLKVHGASITPLIGQLRWAMFVWALASVFINGGILYTLVKRTPNWLAFWTGGATCFKSFLKITLIYLLLILTWSGLTLLPFLAQLQVSLETMASEKTVLGWLLVVVVGWFIGVIFLNNASIVSRTSIVQQGLTIWQALKAGLRFSFKHFFGSMLIFLVFTGMQLLMVALYWWLEAKSGMVTVGLVVVFFVIQQLLVMARLMSRIMVLAGISNLYQSKTALDSSLTL